MSWTRLARVTAPSGDIVTLGEAKAHLRVDFADDDDLIGGLIEAAIGAIDGPKGVGVCLLTQQWRLSLDGLPCTGSWWRREPSMRRSIEIPLSPVISVDEITYLDLGGVRQTLDASLYVYDLDAKPLRIERAFGQVWPQARHQPGSVKVTFTAGFGEDATGIPADLKAAMKLLIGHYYVHREAVVGVDNRDSSAPLPLGVDLILNRYRPAL